MTYIPDITVFSWILVALSFLVIVVFFWKLRQYQPQIEDALAQVDEAISQKEEAFAIAEDLYAKSSTIVPLLRKLKELVDDSTKAYADDGSFSEQEVQALIAKAGLIVRDPAMQELIDAIEGYTCSKQ